MTAKRVEAEPIVEATGPKRVDFDRQCSAGPCGKPSFSVISVGTKGIKHSHVMKLNLCEEHTLVLAESLLVLLNKCVHCDPVVVVRGEDGPALMHQIHCPILRMTR